MKNIVLIGPSGSGKGTIAEFLVRDFGFTHVSTGDLFRKHREERSVFWEKVKPYYDSGKWVPDSLTDEMLFNHIRGMDKIILDGYPRTLGQAKVLDKNIDIDVALLLDVSDEIVFNRLMSRARDDDSEIIIRERLRSFHLSAKDIKRYYREQGKLVEVTQEHEIGKEEVYKMVRSALGV